MKRGPFGILAPQFLDSTSKPQAVGSSSETTGSANALHPSRFDENFKVFITLR